MTRQSFIPLFVTNLFGTMNDNFLKALASFIVIGWIQDASLRPVFRGVMAGALVLPFILCSPLADRLTVVFPKRRILQLAKWAEIPTDPVCAAGVSDGEGVSRTRCRHPDALGLLVGGGDVPDGALGLRQGGDGT